MADGAHVTLGGRRILAWLALALAALAACLPLTAAPPARAATPPSAVDAIGALVLESATPGSSLPLASSGAAGSPGPTASPGASLPPAAVVMHGPRTQKMVALTFDDGYNADVCESIREILVDQHVTATWFPNAVFMTAHPDVWQRIAADFPIGNHTYTHRDLRTLSARQVRNQLVRDERTVESITGHPILKVLRPPYGSYDRQALEVAGSLGYATVLLWDVSDGDAEHVSPQTAERTAERGGKGAVVLMHCGPSIVPRILPRIIESYRARGFAFATVPQLLSGQMPVHLGPGGDPRAFFGPSIAPVIRILLDAVDPPASALRP
jgi:peptidoglycan/xylan/chitin deacetylase (PgdA/CDA1 family)